ncbi:hypothetical protein NOVO_06540 [Rickettsiales bacterium Ac37b]|nr:hypothetical protein NOVO_06540 [Rickettsiales bacterium Ac37b]
MPAIKVTLLKDILLSKMKSDAGFFPGKLICVLNIEGNHWTGIVIEQQNSTTEYVITYIDPLDKSVSISTEIKDILNNILDPDNEGVIKFQNFSQIWAQPVGTVACGPYLCENLRRYICNSDLNVENPGEVVLRAKHISMLGKDFEETQFTNKSKPTYNLNSNLELNIDQRKQVMELSRICAEVEDELLKEELGNLFINQDEETIDFLDRIRCSLDKYYSSTQILARNDQDRLNKFLEIVGIVRGKPLKVDISILEELGIYLKAQRFALLSKSTAEIRQEGIKREQIIKEKISNNEDLRLIIAMCRQAACLYTLFSKQYSNEIDINKAKAKEWCKLIGQSNFNKLIQKYSIKFDDFVEYTHYLQIKLAEELGENKNINGIAKIYVGIGVLGDFHKNKGFKINEVFKGCPAEKVGLRKGDIITSVYYGDQKISMLSLDPRKALSYIRGELGDKLKLEIKRNNAMEIVGKDVYVARDTIHSEYKILHNYVKHAYVKGKVPKYIQKFQTTEATLQDGIKILQEIYENVSNNKEKYYNLTEDEKKLGTYTRKTIKQIIYDEKYVHKGENYTSLINRERSGNIYGRTT